MKENIWLAGIYFPSSNIVEELPVFNIINSQYVQI